MSRTCFTVKQYCYDVLVEMFKKEFIMKRKLIFVFFCFFFFNFSWVSADPAYDGTDYSDGDREIISASYGIACTYGGSRSWRTATSTTVGGGNNEGSYPWAYTLWVHCNNTSCGKLRVSTYGLIKNKSDKDTEIVIDNKDNLEYMVNYNSDKFGFVEGRGVTKCPDIGFEFPNYRTQAGMLENVDKFGNLLIGNGSLANASLLSSKLYSVQEARDFDLKGTVREKMKDKHVVVTITTGEGANATTHVYNAGLNSDMVDAVIRYAEKYLGEDFSDLEGEITCADLLGSENVELLSGGFLILSIIGVLLLVITGIGDFVSAITSNEDGAVLKAFNKFKTRIIACVILLLLPAFIDFVLGFINDSFHYETTAGQGTEIKVGNVSDCNLRSS